MSLCLPCKPALPCINPLDVVEGFWIYPIQGFLFVVHCPVGYSCTFKTIPIPIPPDEIPPVPIPSPPADGSPYTLSLQGCISLITRTVPAGATWEEVSDLAYAMMYQWAWQQAQCDAIINNPPSGPISGIIDLPPDPPSYPDPPPPPPQPPTWPKPTAPKPGKPVNIYNQEQCYDIDCSCNPGDNLVHACIPAGTIGLSLLPPVTTAQAIAAQNYLNASAMVRAKETAYNNIIAKLMDSFGGSLNGWSGSVQGSCTDPGVGPLPRNCPDTGTGSVNLSGSFFWCPLLGGKTLRITASWQFQTLNMNCNPGFWLAPSFYVQCGYHGSFNPAISITRGAGSTPDYGSAEDAANYASVTGLCTGPNPDIVTVNIFMQAHGCQSVGLAVNFYII